MRDARTPQNRGRERRESRAAVLRRNEQTRVLSASDDEVGGHARCAKASVWGRAENRGTIVAEVR